MKKLKKTLCVLAAAITLSTGLMPSVSYNYADTVQTITASATQTRSGNFSKAYKRTGNPANDIVAVAEAQCGKNGRNLGYSEEWCADFVTDCARLAGDGGVPYNYNNRGSCISLYKYMVKSCGANDVSPKDAKKGDLIFFDWAGKKSVNNLHHVAIVTGYSNGKITVIGGNQGTNSTLYTRKVSYATYSINSKSVAKIVRPKSHGSVTPPKPVPSIIPPSIVNNSTYFKKYTGSSGSISDALKAIGATNTFAYRKQIAAANGIANYSGTASQNTKLLNLLKQGKLKKPTNSTSTTNTTTVKSPAYFKKYTGRSGSISDALKAIGATNTYAYRKQIAAANGIANYSGTASQNTKLLNLLKQGKLIKP